MNFNKIKIYTLSNCFWCEKQKKELPKLETRITNNLKIIDCSKNVCPTGIKAFPTIEFNNKRIEGFQKADELSNFLSNK